MRTPLLLLCTLGLAGCGLLNGLGKGGPDDSANAALSIDRDDDGYGEEDDCDDEDPSVNPAAIEECDGIDNDCDGEIDEGMASTFYADNDGDGFGDAASALLACEKPDGYVPNNTDCDDYNANAWPGNEETCDNVDNDCDGEIDEDISSTWYTDADADGYGDPATAFLSCTLPVGAVLDGTDCDDASAEVHPDGEEICDGLDNDCDGEVDEGLSTTWYVDADGDGYGGATTTEACAAPDGYTSTPGDCDDGTAAAYPGADEICDDIDNDCDGDIDEVGATGTSTWYADADGDGYGDAGTSTVSCDAPAGWVGNDDDCDDADAVVSPSATETCNGADDDCDGVVDEPDAADASTWYADLDGDGYGDVTHSRTACTEPPGYISDATDCDDRASDVHPGAAEVCDGRDNDCDGAIDEGAVDATTWYTDADGDGYGDASTATISCDSLTGYVTNDDDCDDTTAAASPAHAETCDGIDNDCDGAVDESGATGSSTWYADDDGDGYGDSAASATACTAPSGYVSDATDCDDAHATVHPTAAESCDGLDNDCDGAVDEGVTNIWYRDADADGYGTASTSYTGCAAPSGYVASSTDCDDAHAAAHPGATEVCDGLDNDCDGTVDEGVTGTWYRDADADGYGDASTAYAGCSAPSGYVASSTDCDDAHAAAHPGGVEVCDDLDNDCDGSVDDDPTDGTTWYADADGDGFGDASSTIIACDEPAGYTDNTYDCDDADASEPVVVDAATGSTSGSGSASNPFDTIQDGIDLASTCVVVYGGTYDESIDLAGKSIDLWGVEGAASTIIDPGGAVCTPTSPTSCAPAVSIDDEASATPTIHGFTIQGGTGHVTHTATSDTCADSSPSPAGEDTCTVDIYEYCGGGVYVSGDDPTLYDVIIQDNTLPEFGQVKVDDFAQVWMYSFGGGICDVGGVVTLKEAWVLDNFADQGGGLYATASGTLSIAHSVITQNDAVDGGGANLDSASMTVNNAIFACNDADTDGGAVFLQGPFTTAYLVNAVFYGDTSAVGATHGAMTYGAVATSFTLTNSIVTTAIASYAVYGNGTGSFTYADVYNSASAAMTYGGAYTAGAYDISADPKFVSADCDGNPADDDFHLAAGSPGIDGGKTGALFLDVDGSRNDLGAFGGPAGEWEL